MKIKLDGTVSLNGEIQQEETMQCDSEGQNIEQDDLNGWQVLFMLLIPAFMFFLFGYFKGGGYAGFQFLKFFGISIVWFIVGLFILCFLSYEAYRIFEEKPSGKDFLMSAGALIGIGLLFIVIKQSLPAAYSFLDTMSNIF